MYGKINRMEQSPGVCEVLQPSAPKERMTALENKCAIKMENITKRFGKVVANNAINMELREGEILSLLGENGSGKTTLMNMLSGIYFPDEGQIYIHDKPVTIASPKDAFALGIGMIISTSSWSICSRPRRTSSWAWRASWTLPTPAKRCRTSATSTASTSTPT